MYCLKLLLTFLATRISTFSIFIISVKMVNHYEFHVIFQDIEYEVQESILHHFFDYIFRKIFIKLRNIFYPLKIIYWKLLRHCLTIQMIYIPILNIRRFFIFIIIFHVFVISFCIWINKVRWSSSYTFFYH